METIQLLTEIPTVILTLIGGGIIAILFLAIQLWWNGKAIRKLSEAKHLNDLNALLAQMTNVSNTFTSISSQMTKLQNDFEQLTQQDNETNLKDGLKEITQELKDENIIQETDIHSAEKYNDAAKRFKKIQDDWEKFTEIFKRKCYDKGKNYNGWNLGKVAEQFTHGKMTNFLKPDEVDRISQLQSLYKRFAKLQESKEEWLTQKVYTEFNELLKWAIDRIKIIG